MSAVCAAAPGPLAGTPFFPRLRSGGSRTPQRRGSGRRCLLGRACGCSGAGLRDEALGEPAGAVGPDRRGAGGVRGGHQLAVTAGCQVGAGEARRSRTSGAAPGRSWMEGSRR